MLESAHTTSTPVTLQPRAPIYLLGCDLGQAQDFTALTILELSFTDTGEREHRSSLPSASWHDGRRRIGGEVHKWSIPIYTHHYAARHLERLPKGTPYPAQVARIQDLYENLTLMNGVKPRLVVDATGVGRPVTDMLRAAKLNPIAVSITAGDTVTQDGDNFRVPKRDLVSTIQVLLQSERLKIAKALPDAQTLVDELLAFKVNINQRGHDAYGNDVGSWRENPHDDLVLATALACWFGEQHKPLSYAS